MLKLIQQAPDDFKTLKGAEVSRNEKATAYKVDLTKTITDFNEMKSALATNFFGSMLTTDDFIVVTGSSTIYYARYDDAEVTDFVGKTFLGMPAFLGPGSDAKMEDLKMDTATAHAYILSIKGGNIARFNYDTQTGKGLLLIGIKK